MNKKITITAHLIWLAIMTCLVSLGEGETEVSSNFESKRLPLALPLVRCLDKLEDFESDNWYSLAHLKYVKNSTELPEPLVGKFDDEAIGGGNNDGIFYYECFRDGGACNLYPDDGPSTQSEPAFMYIKYYSHLTTNSNQETFVTPAKGHDEDPPKEHLPKTENFTWTEKLIELDSKSYYYYQVGVTYFGLEEYFLIEKIMVTNGHPIRDISDMLPLCGW